MKRLAITVAALWVLCAVAGAAPAAQAAECDATYAAIGGEWSEPANWQSGELPTSAQNVCIPAGHGTVEIPFLFHAEANRVKAESPLKLELAGHLKLADATPGEQDASVLTDATLGGEVTTAGSWLMLDGNTRLQGAAVRPATPGGTSSARLISGTMSGAGQFGIPFVNEGGDVEPGGAGTVGDLFFLGGFTQAEGGTLTLDVAGPNESDFLEGGSAAGDSFAGTVQVRPIAPFSPKLGELWKFAKSSTVSFEDPATGDYRAFSEGSGKSYIELIEAEGPPPAVTRLSAKKGPGSGGTSVVITGTNFTRSSKVRFGPNAASSVVGSSTSITTVSPAGTTGAVEVTVETPNGHTAVTSKARFIYEAPTVTGVSPATGTVAGGSPVTVTGTGFALGAGTSFKFGKGLAGSVSCASSTECTLVAPAAARAGTVNVRARAGGKTSHKNPPSDQFTYTG